MSRELLAAVHGLIEGSKVRLFRDGTDKGQWQALPSIWDQLCDSSQQGNGSGSRAANFPRPVISTAVVALRIDITAASTETAVELVGKSRGSVPDNLRAISANLTDAEQIGWWTEQVLQWTQEARGHLRLDPDRPRYVRGVACPQCGAKNVRRRQDGEMVRTPALSLTWIGPDDGDYHEDDRWLVRAVECRACGVAWFRGEAMDALVNQMLEANRTRETMCDNV